MDGRLHLIDRDQCYQPPYISLSHYWEILSGNAHVRLEAFAGTEASPVLAF
jgi:hypothetical protein